MLVCLRLHMISYMKHLGSHVNERGWIVVSLTGYREEPPSNTARSRAEPWARFLSRELAYQVLTEYGLGDDRSRSQGVEEPRRGKRGAKEESERAVSEQDSGYLFGSRSWFLLLVVL